MAIPLAIKNIPQLPGVYLFKDSNNVILYVGKAKLLRKRVASYFARQKNDWKIGLLMQEQATVDYIVTKNEIEAQLLEAQLVKDYQPKYNVLLKEGNPFVYFLFKNDPDAIPEMKLVRTKKERGTYVGPFLAKSSARHVYDYLVRMFRLYRCNYTIAQGCLDFHLGKCAGSCRNAFDRQEYEVRMQLAQQVLAGDYAAYVKIIAQQVQQYTDSLEFEKARHLHEYAQNFDVIAQTIKTKFTPQSYAHARVLSAIAEPQMIARKTAENEQALHELQLMLGMDYTPKTIDCFDISHFQGRDIVGSCVRFTNGKLDKNNVRRFKITTLEDQNDYAALQEIVIRRYKDVADIPDVVLIDGGKGQRSAVKAVLPHALVISLAKREETIFADNHPQGIVLNLQDPVGRLLIAIRDYAHHFAVSYHTVLRKKSYKQ